MLTGMVTRRCVVLMAMWGIAVPTLCAAVLESAEVTAAINQVTLAEPGSSGRPASVGDTLRGKALLETGSKSRAELTFNDRSIARLGANSVFSFSRGTRDLELNRGVILMQVPKDAGGATIQTAAVTAAITGTTIAIEFVPAGDGSPGVIKIFVLEGTLRASLRGVSGESMLLEAGQMIAMQPGDRRLPDARVFDIGRLVQTSGLLSSQFQDIPSENLILQNINLQNADKTSGRLIISNFTLHQKYPGGLQQFRQQTQNTAIRVIAKPPPAQPKPPPIAAPAPPPPPTPAPTPPTQKPTPHYISPPHYEP
jgi:hypothetical protein